MPYPGSTVLPLLTVPTHLISHTLDLQYYLY
jgi:hypothetical protein